MEEKKMSKKVRCCFCSNEKDGFCNVKKVKVKANKPRLCEGYIFEESKIKPKKPIPTTRVSPLTRSEQKKLYKEQLLKGVAQTGNSAHPLTGDLSRFTTTAEKEG